MLRPAACKRRGRTRATHKRTEREKKKKKIFSLKPLSLEISVAVSKSDAGRSFVIHTRAHANLSPTDMLDSLTWEFVFMAQSKQPFHFCKRHETR